MYSYLRESYSATEKYLETANPRGISVLKREESETYDLYHSRLDRCPVRNHIGLIIDRYNSAAKNQEVIRDEDFIEFYKNYESIFWDALLEAQIVGKCYIVATLNNAERLSEIDLQLFSVPLDRVVEYVETTLFAFTDERDNTIVYLEDGSWQKLNKQKEVIETGLSGFNQLPVIEVYPKFAGKSQVAMLAPIQETLVNYLSLHSEESSQSTFTRHTIDGLSQLPETPEEDRMVQKMLAGKRLLLFKDKISVSSLSGDVGQAQNLLKAIEQTENMLYAVAGLRLSEPIRESGLAKQLEMAQFIDIRNKLVIAIEEAENKFIELLNSSLGVFFENTWYSKEATSMSYDQKITELQALLSIADLTPEFRQAVVEKFQADYLE
jgi:hypothetical protein